MARGSTDLDSREYDDYLAQHKKERELRARHQERKSKGYAGWHFGMGAPFKSEGKKEFHQELERRGCLDAHSMKQITLANGKKVYIHK